MMGMFLAILDGPTLQWVVSCFLTVAMCWIGAKTLKIDTLEGKLEKSANERIDAKFENSNIRLESAMERFNLCINSVNQRLERGDAHFKEYENAKADLRLETQLMVSKLREDMSKDFASKEDFQKLNETVTDIRVLLAKFLGVDGGGTGSTKRD